MQMSLFPPEEKKVVELIKHTAAIHIKGNLSLVDRKLIYLAIKNIAKKWNNQPVQNWSLIIGQLDIFFAGRLKLDLA